jgi:hypothetical protein
VIHPADDGLVDGPASIVLLASATRWTTLITLATKAAIAASVGGAKSTSLLNPSTPPPSSPTTLLASSLNVPAAAAERPLGGSLPPHEQRTDQ